MKFPYFSVNAFCKGVFSGNPASVCILDKWLSTDELQNMASQLYFPVTAFLFPGKNGVWSIRWFTPKAEVDLCGHATMAAAHVLFEEGLVTKGAEITFSSNSGKLRIGNDGNGRISMNFPLLKARNLPVSPALVEGLGAYPDEVYMGTNCLCVFGEEETIYALEPDFRVLSGFNSCIGVIVTAKTSRIGYHFVSRYFAPRVGIDEDHGTGSAHCLLAPFWGKKLHKDKLVGFQASPRGAEIRCELKGDRVILSGTAETFVRGKMTF
jgi:PhzF family phenazine biosynthesis protein